MGINLDKPVSKLIPNYGTSCFIGFKQKMSNTNGFCNQQTSFILALGEYRL